MADGQNIFDQFDGDASAPQTLGSAHAAPVLPAADEEAQPRSTFGSPNVFDQFDEDLKPENETSASGSFFRAGERSLLPSAGGLAAMGTGAELGAAGGFAVAGPPGAVVGGVAGGVAGALGGSWLVGKAQDWTLSALPDSWTEKLGQDDRQQQLDQEYHPTASFLGGIAPYALTLRPSFSAMAKALPENATAWQRILANPITARLFGGATMGGMELGQEVAAGQKPDWRNVAISTGFGMVFNKPTRLGEAITEIGAAPTRAALGVASPEAAPVAAPAAPTVAQAGDAKVMGPGITEDVFMGSHGQAPEAEMTAQDAARTENSLLGPPADAPDVGVVARRMEPETFQGYDALSAQRDDLRAHLSALASPSDEEVQTATAERDALQAQLDDHIAARGGYTAGPQARAFRAQIRDAQNQIDDLAARRDAFAAGNITETPEMAQVRQQLLATDFAMRDMAPRVSAAYRRAADAIGSGVVEPEAPPVVPAAPQVAGAEPAIPGAPLRPSAQEQAAAIAQSVAAELVAAGRPADEARAAGELIGQRYKTRAARMDNAIGGPQALYESEGPTIRAGGARAPRAATVSPAVDAASAKAIADTQGVTNLITRMIGAGASDAEISTIIGKKLSVDQVAAFREGLAPPQEAAAPEREMAQGRTLDQPAYHGSPHRFDRFSSDKIGTGEGAQAYGHGLYFTGKKEIAEWYRDNLAKETFSTKSGETWSPDRLQHLNVRASARKAGADLAVPLERAKELLPSAPEQTRPMLEHDIAQLEALIRGGGVSENKGRLYHVEVPEEKELLDWDKPLYEQPKEIRDRLATLGIKVVPEPAPIADIPVRQLVRRGLAQADGDPRQLALVIDNDGELYRGAVKIAERNGLDSEALDAKGGAGAYVEELAKDYLGALTTRQEQTGEKIYRDLSEKIAMERPAGPPDSWTHVINTINDRLAADADASAALRGAGIPGHRYLGQTTNETNYVIYDDARVAIRQYEQAKRGSITLTAGQRPIIKLFKDADASTFIHETGHQWLEELLRDAAHPAAGDSVRDDAQTVKTWLGVEGDAVKTRQHEKFARGFEQYMREGVAPTQGLARVFAQFKTWLSSIYQTIKGLGTPISDDIRGVFDRLIAEEPNRTVLAAERGAQPSLADIHETEAAEAHPSEAHGIGDRIAAERDRYVADQPPEIQDELSRADAERAAAGAEPRGQGDAGAGRPGEVAGGGSPAGPVAPSGIGSGERGAELGRSAPGVAEGAGLPGGARPTGGPEPAGAGLREQRSEPAGGAGPQPLATSPATLFGPKESPFTDKAGNIRLGNLTTNADVAQAIRDAADENNDFIGERRAVITDGQVLDLADALGMDPEQLQKRRLGQAFNAEQIVAARKLLIQSATEVSAAMKRAAAGTDEDVMAYAEAKARHQMIQGQVSGITAEAGRALRAFRSLAGQEQAQSVDQFLRNSTAKTLFQLKAEAKLGALLDTPQDVSKFINDARRRGFWDGALEYWINGLISGPATHVTYSIGNTILALEKAGPETAAAAAIGAIRRAAGRPGEVVHLGEVSAQIKAALAAIPSAAKAAAESLRTGVTTRLPGETPRSMPFQPSTQFAPSAVLDENFGYRDVAPDVFGAVRGLRDALVATGTLVRAGGVEGEPVVGARFSQLGAIPDITLRGINVLPLGTAARLPSRFVASIHSFFRAVNYSMAKNAMAYRAAAEEGLSGEAFDARTADLRQNPTPEMMDASRESATQATLMGQGSEFIQKLTRLTNARIGGVPILKFIDPFVHIAGNIIDQSIVQRTPVGLLSSEIRADLSGRNGNIAQDTAMARMLVGTGLSIAFGSLAAEGLVSGSGPSDRNQAAAWRLGNQAHSIRIGDMWYGMNRLGPMGMLASVAADMYDVAHAAADGDLQTVGSSLMHAITQNILDESFMSGPAQFIQAVEDPGRYGQAYIRNFISSFVPYSVGLAQMNRTMDPYSRQARTVMDAIKAKVPGLSETLLPRRDIWGNPVPSLRGVGGTAIYETQVGHDPVNQALLDLGIYPAPVDRKIRNIALSDQQYDDYAKIAGRMAKQRLDVIVGSPDWQTWTPTTRHDVMLETIRQSRETARGYMMMRNPDIVRQATAQKLSRVK